MLGAYASVVGVLAVSTLVGQAIFAVSGRRTWSPLSPAVGLAAASAIAWATVRLPGEGTAAAISLGLVAVAALAYLRGRLDAGGSAGLRPVLAVAALAVLAASLPFIVEARIGILGTGLNPDLSQHLFAADRLAAGGSELLISDGYPLGPHALVVGLAALGPSTVQAFDGLIVAVAVASCLAPLALLDRGSSRRWIAGALVVGFAYLVSAYLVQGAFKETMQALYLLAFAIGLHLLAKEWSSDAEGPRPLRAVPLAVLAIGSVYAYSFPGLAWLAGAAAAWAAVELLLAARRGGFARARELARAAAPATAVAVLVLVVAIAPEIGRIVRFAEFETFDPEGPGLGNLFNRLSPLEALGIWPSGDFRVEPGDGEVPAIVFYLGAALGLAALALGLRWALRRGERAIPAALAAAVVLWLYALVGGTPYQEAKALLLVAPLVAVIAVRALLAAGPAWLAAAYLVAAGGSGVLALANGPVGPSEYSPALAELREELRADGFDGSLAVIADREFLDEEHGRDYLVWELRGNRICVAADDDAAAIGQPGISLVVEVDDVGSGEMEISERPGAPGRGPCPFISDGARADPGADD